MRSLDASYNIINSSYASQNWAIQIGVESLKQAPMQLHAATWLHGVHAVAWGLMVLDGAAIHNALVPLLLPHQGTGSS
eukprot:365472-Chlamydomonas_euryale.AAC.6